MLRAAFDAAVDGRGSIVVLAGEPGIGKSTLADAFGDHAAAQGAVTVWGRCWDAGGAPAYWAWQQVVRHLAGLLDDDELAAAGGASGRWLVRIAPELDARIPGEDPIEPVEAEQARFALYDALARFLGAGARRAPIVILLDDLHAADVATLRALDFVARAARELPLLVVATLQEVPLRKRPDAADLVQRLEHSGERLELTGLSVEEVGALLGDDVDDGVARQVHERSAGNPLFAGEIARALPDGGSVDRLPGGVQAMLRQRLAELGADSTRVLNAAAVIGHEFRLVTAERVADMDRPTLLDALDEAEAAGVVQPVGTTGRYRFRHGLIRETLYADQRKGRRAQQHLRVAEVLRELYAGQAEDRHLSELAFHFVEAASLGDSGPAVHWSRQAGGRAMRVFAFEHAADHFQAALRAIELGSPDEAARARLLLELGRAQAAAAHPDAEATLIHAADLARTLADPELFAEAASAFGPYALSPGTVDDRWVGLLEEALRSLPPAAPARRARLMAELGRALYFAPGEGARRHALADEALTLARTLEDPWTLAAVLSDAHVATWGPDRTHENLETIAELHALLEELGDPRQGLPALVRSIDMQLELGDLVAAGIALERLERRSTELRDIRASVLALLHRSRMAIVEGRFADVPPLLTEAANRGGALRASPVAIMVGGQSYIMRMLRGGLVDFEPVVRQLADGLPNTPVWRAALARVHVEAGDDAQAILELDRAAAGGFGRVERDSLFLPTIGLFGEVAWRVGSAEHEPVMTALLAPFADRMMVTAGAVFFGPVARPLALLAALRGDHDAALGHFALAREGARRIAAAPSAVVIDVDEAAVRLQAGDAEGAAALLDGARTDAARLGLDGVAVRLQTLQDALDAGPRRIPSLVERGTPIDGRLVREGDTWSLQLDDRAVRLRDSKGVGYLAMLLAHPGIELHSIDLVSGAGGVSGAGAGAAALDADAGMVARADAGGSGPLLDAAAKEAYRERILDLRETIDEAERFNDPERAASAREELDAIAGQLAGAVGLGGRDRQTGSAAERARVNVTRALRTTLKRIAEHDAALGGDLEACVRTGLFCSYEPPALHPVTWQVDDGRR